MSLIQVTNLSFTYDGSVDPVFEHVSFQMDTRWRLGFTGRNGRGKTTFLRLLMGAYSYAGTISADVTFEYFPYAVSNNTATTLNAAQSICPDAAQWELLRELSLLGFDETALARPYSTLSPGEQTKLMLAALFLHENSFLLIDEPTNHLDAQARALVSGYLKKKSGFLLVSHDRTFLDACTDHTLAINKTNIEIQRGNFSAWWHNKNLQDTYETEQNDRLKQNIRRLAATSREKAQWSDKIEASKIGTHAADRGAIGHKAAKMMQRAKAIEARRTREVEEKGKLLKNIETAEALKLSPLTFHSRQLARLENVCACYGETAACGPVSFTVEQGERIALRGRNGCGKSSILKLLAGDAAADAPLVTAGTLFVPAGLQISYVPQTTGHLHGSLDALCAARGIDESLCKAILRKLDFSRAQFEKNMETYSGGQKKKVLLAASLCERAHLFLWDEPLNFVDVISRMQVEALLVQYAPTLVFVEHDSAFCTAVASRIVSL